MRGNVTNNRPFRAHKSMGPMRTEPTPCRARGAARYEGRRSGHVFNVSSLGAYNVGPLSGVYCATKRAVKVISETLAQELVVGTPVYFAGANGALLALLDRAFYAASVHGRRFAGKPACAVTTLWRAGSTSTLDELNRCFTFSGMPVASSTYWNMMFNSGDDPFGEDMLRQLGENMAHLVRTTRV